jgi:hypothetical protein
MDNRHFIPKLRPRIAEPLSDKLEVCSPANQFFGQVFRLGGARLPALGFKWEGWAKQRWQPPNYDKLGQDGYNHRLLRAVRCTSGGVDFFVLNRDVSRNRFSSKCLSQNRRGLAHFAESSQQNVPVPLLG